MNCDNEQCVGFNKNYHREPTAHPSVIVGEEPWSAMYRDIPRGDSRMVDTDTLNSSVTLNKKKVALYDKK
jgi:hypothetical protein